ncbi:hypothetical protein ATB93_18075 [Sphingomonas sp. WG]|nr:hypothetical protein ATB93_18075 [Sphingomonas sp. WG]
MGTIAQSAPRFVGEARQAFVLAVAMTATIVLGFSAAIAMGFSSFSAPPIVHLHAIVFMGWVAFYLLQSSTALLGSNGLHRRLGWIAPFWLVSMIVLGTAVTVRMVRAGRVPPMFQPQHFLAFDPMAILGSALLVLLAVRNRKRTDWHWRLQTCGMALLTGPGWGRLIGIPPLIPWAYHVVFAATLLFPLAGAIWDARRSGRVHPAWLLGVGVMLGVELVIDCVTWSPIGSALYAAATAGSPGASVAPLAFPPLG